MSQVSFYLQKLLHRFLKTPPPYIDLNFLGHPLKVREATIKLQKPDYDDAWLYACALRAETVFDIGSNVGQAAMLISLSPSVRALYLVEPNRDALIMAADNLIQNHHSDQAHFIVAFVSDTVDKTVDFWTVGTGSAGSMYDAHAISARKQGTHFVTKTVTIDALCARYGVIPDFIKLDIEGAERLALAGARTCVASKKTRFLVEVHSNPDLPMVENAKSILDWCQKNSYSAWYLKNKTLLRDAEVVAGRGRCHVLLQPQEWLFPEWLKGIEQGDSVESVPVPSA